jgi:hypothetical protein
VSAHPDQPGDESGRRHSVCRFDIHMTIFVISTE